MDKEKVYQFLQHTLSQQAPALKITQKDEEAFEASGTRQVMQGKKMVDGYYFASVMMKPKDVRFYFFPIYTHPDAYDSVSPEVRKCLKGKSCFHLKNMDEAMLKEIEDMIQKGVKLYQDDDLI
jgi:hypothetical protein